MTTFNWQIAFQCQKNSIFRGIGEKNFGVGDMQEDSAKKTSLQKQLRGVTTLGKTPFTIG